jgi:hypothetical protein
MTEPKGTTSPAKVDRWAATALLRAASSTVALAAESAPSVRLATQWGQLVACWSSLAEQAGHVLDMDCSLVGTRS